MKIFKSKTFCSKYWRANYIRGKLNHPVKAEVSQMRYLTFLNHKLLTGKNPHNINNFAKSFGYSFEENIRNADIEFKNIQKTKKDITVYRGIAKPNENKDIMYCKLFNKAQNLKEKEIIVMKEYAFAAFDKNIAQKHMKESGGILYEITVPKGARISQLPWEVAFPRYSKFECTENKEIKGKNNYNFIKLKYNLPVEDWNIFPAKLAKIFKKQK